MRRFNDRLHVVGRAARFPCMFPPIASRGCLRMRVWVCGASGCCGTGGRRAGIPAWLRSLMGTGIRCPVVRWSGGPVVSLRLTTGYSLASLRDDGRSIPGCASRLGAARRPGSAAVNLRPGAIKRCAARIHEPPRSAGAGGATLASLRDDGRSVGSCPGRPHASGVIPVLTHRLPHRV